MKYQSHLKREATYAWVAEVVYRLLPAENVPVHVLSALDLHLHRGVTTQSEGLDLTLRQGRVFLPLWCERTAQARGPWPRSKQNLKAELTTLAITSSSDSLGRAFSAFVASMTFCRPWFIRL